MESIASSLESPGTLFPLPLMKVVQPILFAFSIIDSMLSRSRERSLRWMREATIPPSGWLKTKSVVVRPSSAFSSARREKSFISGTSPAPSNLLSWNQNSYAVNPRAAILRSLSS